MKISGFSVVKGIAIGTVQMVPQNSDGAWDHYVCEDTAAELHKFTEAWEAAKQRLDVVLSHLSESEKQILMAHRTLLDDFAFLDAVKRFIAEGASAPQSVQKAVAEMEALLLSVDDPYLSERAADVKDVGNRLLRALLQIKDFAVKDDAVIVCAPDIDASLMAALPQDRVKGVILGNASKTSHAVIIAKSKGFVTIVGVNLSEFGIQNEDTLILDTVNQLAIINPPKNILQQYQLAVAKQQQESAQTLEKAKQPAKTPDGKEIIVAANISEPGEIEQTQMLGCEGVGLFRTEFLYLRSQKLPGEDEQFEAYKHAAENSHGHLCVIRTLDIGGDKTLAALGIEQESNPFLGWRAIRICLQNKALFLSQIKAILRAGVFGKVAMMIPMVVDLSEITQTKQMMREAMAQLDEENKPYDKDVPLGIMVETPAAAIMASVFAQHVDFFSIGTNDLVQYTLAVDRQNPKVSYLYDHLHPAVVHAINRTVKAAHRWHKWVGLCGEMASDELSIPLLVSMDIDELSMAASMAPKIKEVIRRTRRQDCNLEQVLQMTDAQEIRRYLAALQISK